MKWAWGVTLGLTALLAVEMASGLSQSTSFVWNEVRLARSAALMRGFSLYIGKDDPGPVIGTLHGPVSHCLYLAAALLPDATASIVAGCLLSLLLVFAPLGWMLAYARPRETGAWFATAAAFLFCGFLIVGTQASFNTALMIHTDAPALAFGTLACGIFANPRRPVTVRQAWISGIACAFVIGSKQTLAPLAIAVGLFVAVVAGRKIAIHFLCALLAGGAALLAAVFAAVPAHAFLFNTVTLASHRPLQPDPLKVLAQAFRTAKSDALPALLPLAFLAFFGWLAFARTVDGPPHKARQFVRANRWLLFPLVTAVLIPLTAKAMITVGADINHLGLALYFLFAGAGLSIQQYAVHRSQDVLRRASWFFAALGVLYSIAPGALISLAGGLRALPANPSETAYRYELRHPGRAYFPCNPLAALLAKGKAYHVEYALYDRQIAGYPLSAAQIASGLPPGFGLVAIPRGELILSSALTNLIAGYRQSSDAELPGWKVFRRP